MIRALDGSDLGDQKDMRVAKTSKGMTAPCEIIGKRVLQERIYLLVRCSLPEMSAKARRKVLESYSDRKNAIGFIEWWDRGSILTKPREEFYVIVVLRK
jgi:hypothetical protein